MIATRYRRPYQHYGCIFEVKDPLSPTKVHSCGAPSVGELKHKQPLCAEHFEYVCAMFKVEIVDDKGDVGPVVVKKKGAR
jgi:hypothetical protein